MKKTLVLFSQNVTLLFLIFCGVSCTLPGSASVREGDGADIESAQLEAYNGPKARIAVTAFEDKIGGGHRPYWKAAYGSGLRDMLTTELFQTNRYIVLERQNLKAVMDEQDLGASGRVKKETAAPTGELEGAEILVKAAITGFEPGTGGGKVKVGNKLTGKAGSLIDSLGGSVSRASIAMDLRLIDTKTGRIIAATSVEGSATSIKAGGKASGVDQYGSLSGFAKTPMETAMRECMNQAVIWVVKQTPQNYMHFDPAAGEPTQ